MSLWTFQVGLNVTVDETWVDVTSRHPWDQGGWDPITARRVPSK
jgi:hypothetical protein